MSTRWTTANVDALVKNAAWLEVLERVSNELKVAEGNIESGELFRIGKGVGARNVIQMILDLPAKLDSEAQGKPSITRMFRGKRDNAQPVQ